jgi:hypothetical protein
MASLSAIFSLLNEDRLIERLNVSSEAAIEALLDARDSDEFAARWMVAFASVESMQRIAGQVNPICAFKSERPRIFGQFPAGDPPNWRRACPTTSD